MGNDSVHALLSPAKKRFVFLSFALALFVNLIPWNNQYMVIQPDFMVLVLLYWMIHSPQTVGFLAAFCAGLLMDVADSSLLGQHAMAYCVVGYFALEKNRQVLMFEYWHQSLYILGLLLVSQSLMLLIRMVGGAAFIGWGYFITCFTGALLWRPLSHLLQLPQHQAPQPPL